MKLDDNARALIGSGTDATLVTLNPDGSPQVSVVWIARQTTDEGDDELVTAHLGEHKKVRNVRRDPRVALTIISTDRSGTMTPYLSVTGTARIVEGGAPELLAELAKTMIGPNAKFPPMDDPPPGYLTRISIDKIGGVGPWVS
jgi:PPOX class probable F420-dependent enzyme